jgi:hypothetical protein
MLVVTDLLPWVTFIARHARRRAATAPTTVVINQHIQPGFSEKVGEFSNEVCQFARQSVRHDYARCWSVVRSEEQTTQAHAVGVELDFFALDHRASGVSHGFDEPIRMIRCPSLFGHVLAHSDRQLACVGKSVPETA